MKFWKNKLAVTVIVLSVTFLGIITYSVKKDQGSFITGTAGSTLNPIQKVTYTVIDKVKGGFDFFFNFSSVKRENNDLLKKNTELKNQLIEYNNFKTENDRLRSLLDFKNQKTKYNYVVTNIIGKSGGGFMNGYIIDKGKKDGVHKDMIVVAAASGNKPENIVGLVGQVTESYDSWSKVETLLNENIAVHAMDQNTNDTSGIIKGYRDPNNNMYAKLYYLPMSSEIKKDDVITTSGLGGYYPPDIRIGEVVSVEEDNVKVTKNAIVKPYVNFSKLQDLMVIVPKDYDGKEVKY